MARKPARAATTAQVTAPDTAQDTAQDTVRADDAQAPRAAETESAPDRGTATAQDAIAGAFQKVTADLTEGFQRIITDLQAVNDKLLGASS